MKSPIQLSYALAGLLAVGAVGWIMSGQMESDAPPDEAVTATATSETVGNESAGEEPTLPSVRVRESHGEQHRAVLLYTGKTEAERRATIRAETDGRVVEVGAEESAPVLDGAAIVKLATNDRVSILRKAESLVRQRSLEYDAAKKLAGKGFQSETARAEAEANLSSARATLEEIRLDIDRTEIKAPFDGILERRSVEVGDFVQAGSEIAVVADLDPMIVTVQVTEREIGKVELGVVAKIELVDGQQADGIVSRIATTADSLTRTFEVELEVANDNTSLLDGMTARVMLPSHQVLAHFITPSVLSLDDSGQVGVKSLDQDDRVVFHPITIVEDTSEGMWVGGLPESLRMITVGQAFVAPGARVTAVPEGAVLTTPQEDTPSDSVELGDRS